MPTASIAGATMPAVLTTSSPSAAPIAPCGGSALRPQVSLALALALLALSVAGLVVLAEQLVTQWTDGLLFLAWLLLWVEVFAATAVFDAWRRLHRGAVQMASAGAEPVIPPVTVRAPGPVTQRYGDSAPYL